MTKEMTYLKCKWNHTLPDEPIMLYSELEDHRCEQRKVEVFRDGRMGYADGDQGFGGSALGVELTPPLAETAMDSQFEPVEITMLEFEQVWNEARAQVSER